MLTLKTAIEKINEYEEENYKLQEQVEFFQRKSQRLEKRNKEIYDGFMASNQELCDNAKEISRLNNIIDKLEYWLKMEWHYNADVNEQYAEAIENTLDRLKDLKGGIKNENN